MNQKFEHIKWKYKVPADIGRRVRLNGDREGVIIEDLGNYIGVNFDDMKAGISVPCHPTWEMEYLEMGEIRKASKGQIRYQNYLRSDSELSFGDWLKLKYYEYYE